MKLQERLDARKREFESQAPDDVKEIMHRATEDLRNSGILERAVKVGDAAPDFTLQNFDGQEWSLKAILEEGPVVLSFYRGKW